MILKYIEVVIQLLDKIKKGTSSSKLGKTRPVSKNNKSWSQRILVTGHLWKKRSVVSAFVLQKKHKGDWVFSHLIDCFSNKAHY